MARERRVFGVWALLLALIILVLLGGMAWWAFYRLPAEVVAQQPAIPDAVLKIPGMLQTEVAALKDQNDRLADGIAQADALLKGDVCDPKRQAELETLLQKVEFGAQLETAPQPVQDAARVTPASTAPSGDGTL